MKAYRFRLAGVAHIRQAQEDAAANVLALANLDLRRAEADRRHAMAVREGLHHPTGTVTPEAIAWIQDQAERASEEIRRCTELVERAHDAVVSARQQWLEARQRCAVLERLDERQRADWQKEFDRLESVELDDLASVRYLRQGVRP